MIFEPKQLIAMLSNFDMNTKNVRSHPDIKLICEYCGVCLDTRAARSIAMEGLSATQLISLKVFQENVVQLLELHNKFLLNVIPIPSHSTPFLLSQNISRDFEARAVSVFNAMAWNFVSQLGEVTNKNTGPNEDEDDFINSLCAGDLKNILNLVPSRKLARDLGVSDSRLRRGIYLARQRVLKKRAIPKKLQLLQELQISRDEAKSQGLENQNQSRIENANADPFEDFFGVEVPTCASPVSSTCTESRIETVSDPEDGDVMMTTADGSAINVSSEYIDFIDDDCVIIESEDDSGWTIIKGWLNSDLIEH